MHPITTELTEYDWDESTGWARLVYEDVQTGEQNERYVLQGNYWTPNKEIDNGRRV